MFLSHRRRNPSTETLSDYLAQVFVLDNPHKVIFTRFKAQAIKEKNIQIFYGDSDSDMRAALEEGIRGIRIMRAENSTHKPFPRYGILGEEVLRDFEF